MATTTDDPRTSSALDAALDIFRVRQYFNAVVRARGLPAALRKDAAQLAREHLAMLRRHSRTLLVEPVAYWKVAGTGFYAQFLDNREWPQFMRAGRRAMLASLQHAARDGSQR